MSEIARQYNYVVLDRQAPHRSAGEQASRMVAYATIGWRDVPTGRAIGTSEGEITRDEQRRVKVEAHWDTSYADQGRASMSVWSQDSWEPVVNLMGVEVYKLATEQEGYPWFKGIEDRLITTAAKILNLTSLEEIKRHLGLKKKAGMTEPEVLARRGDRAVLLNGRYAVVDQDVVRESDDTVGLKVDGVQRRHSRVHIAEFLPADGPACNAGGGEAPAEGLDDGTLALKRMVAHLIVLDPLGARPDDQTSMVLAAREKLRNVVELRLGKRGIPLTWYEMSDELFARRVQGEPLSVPPKEE